jgi:hypothetical protein
MSRSGPDLRWRVRGWLAWFVALNALWLVLISAWVPAEEILGLFASAIGATAAEAVREQGLTRFKPRVAWLWQARVLPWRAVTESAVVLAALARHTIGRKPVRGSFRVRHISLPDDPDEQAAKRALATVAESFASNSYVLAIDNRAGLIVTHELVSSDDASAAVEFEPTAEEGG